VLIVVLVMLVILTSLALLMARTMQTEAAAAAGETARLRAAGVADGAVVYLRSVVLAADGAMPKDAEFSREAVQVGTGYFWFLKHDKSTTGTGYAFGISDEGGKLDINRATADALSRLPGMTQDLADAVVDWRDGDDEPGAGGAESGYYLSLSAPYSAKNESFESVEELLMVKGFTRAVLYGGDKNRNMIVDGGETSSTLTGGTSSIQVASSASGVADYLTLYSTFTRSTTGTGGQTQVNVNQGSAQLNDLIVQTVGQDRAAAVLDNIRRRRPHRNILDFYVKSEMTLDQFKQIAERVTTTAVPTGNAATAPVRGLVNLNSAPKEVLTSLGDLTEGDALAIIGKRGDGDGFASIVDLLDVIPVDHAVSVGSLVGVKPGAVSADIVAVDGTGKGFKRMQIVMNMSGTVLYAREMTSLGWPLDPNILVELRAGRGIQGMTGLSPGQKESGSGMGSGSMGTGKVGTGKVGTGKVGTGSVGNGNMGNGSMGGSR
jgi:type II secretory pathway component PulK